MRTNCIKLKVKVISLIAMLGLAYPAAPIMASSSYDPNDKSYDPSYEYVAKPDDCASCQEEQKESATATQASPVAGAGTESIDKNENQETGNNPSEEPSQNMASDAVSPEPTEIEAENQANGTESQQNEEGTVTTKGEEDHSSEISNQVEIENSVTAESVTGQNTSSQNSDDASIYSGDADVLANIISLLNSTIEGLDSFSIPILNIFSSLIGDLSFDQFKSISSLISGQGITDIASNTNTGTDSNNNAEIDNGSDSNVSNENNASLDNDIALGANTGDNTANENTGQASILTGDANLLANIINLVNTSVIANNVWMGLVNIFGDWTGNLLLPDFGFSSVFGGTSETASNQGTGASSNNSAAIGQYLNGDYTINNNADIYDDVLFDLATGNNSASQNTGDADIDTGEIRIIDNQLDFVNNTIIGGNWWMMAVNTLEGFSGVLIGEPDGTISYIPIEIMDELIAENSETGSGSENSATIENGENSSNEINNNADVSNDITLIGNTGSNEASRNTGNANIATGDATAISNLINFVNNTFKVENWMLGIINVFGKWDGDIFWGNDQEKSGGLISQVLSAVNSNTGEESENNASINNQKRTNFIINNNANIHENLEINAETGNNSTECNTGLGQIITGGISITARISNFANNVIIQKPKKVEKETKPEEKEEKEQNVTPTGQIPLEIGGGQVESLPILGERLPEAGEDGSVYLLAAFSFIIIYFAHRKSRLIKKIK